MKCENCNINHNRTYGSGRFCSKFCAASFATKDKRKEINKKISNSLKGKPSKLKGRIKNIICKLCKNCHIAFETININQQTCSIICSNKFRRINNDGFEKYKQLCQFSFNVYDYPNQFDLSLIKKYGWYKAKNRGDNPNGISRDHIISIVDGFNNRISYKLLSHPANCKLMRHSENNKKNTKSAITLDELKQKIFIIERKKQCLKEY